MNTWQQRLETLDSDRLRGMLRGVEKESLRANADGTLALTPHPKALGSALTHPHVTTDFSESQLELITGVHHDADACLGELTDIHLAVQRSLGKEMMWTSSMPCVLPPDETIPLGMYGSSNIGRAKSVYRMGLGHRYGRRMQTISGIHYNWSLPGVGSDGYFSLIRNFRRHSFLLLLLFGASPALSADFVAGRGDHGLQESQAPQRSPCDSLYLPHATSLRMGRLGYQSDAQSSLAVSYNGLEGYASSLEDALTQPYPPYERIGVMNLGGEYNQLSTSLLQIENEFYGTIRPKRVIRSGERPLHALRQRGVEYVEVRCMDLDPFEPVGIAAGTMRFIDIFLLHCLFSDSPPDTPEEIAALATNQQLTASRGREPGLMLQRRGQAVSLMDWSRELIAEFEAIAAHLDAKLGGSLYREAWHGAQARLSTPDELPSARVLQAMGSTYSNSHIQFTRAQSLKTREHLLALEPNPGWLRQFEQAAHESLLEQTRIERADTLPFEQFRQQYLSSTQLLADAERTERAA
ncbi:MAG: glutamate--cysteine ligase [Burkholderiaceae bacterium]|nr:glutamate--cysteine ligase [Burkholderiaceae bacterium]